MNFIHNVSEITSRGVRDLGSGYFSNRLLVDDKIEICLYSDNRDTADQIERELLRCATAQGGRPVCWMSRQPTTTSPTWRSPTPRMAGD